MQNVLSMKFLHFLRDNNIYLRKEKSGFDESLQWICKNPARNPCGAYLFVKTSIYVIFLEKEPSVQVTV